MKTACALTVAVTLAAAAPVFAQKRPVTPSDCVTVRDLQHDDSTWRSSIKISPDGNRVAYPVAVPNLKTNENDVELYVRNLPEDPTHSDMPVLVGDISAARWMADGHHLTVLIKENGRRVLERVDTETGHREVLVKAAADIAEYSTDRSGDTVVYAIDEPQRDHKSGPGPQEIASGYRIQFQQSGDAFSTRRNLFVTRRTSGGWTTPEPIRIKSPLSQESTTMLVYAANAQLQPTISPDGENVLISYFDYSEVMPDEWHNSGWMQHRNSSGVAQVFHILVLYDLATKATTVPLKTPWTVSAPIWSFDSKSFVVVAAPPIGSDLERENVKTHLIGHSAGAHLFWVEPGTGKIEDIASRLANPWGGPLWWDKNADLFSQESAPNTIARFSRTDGKWREVASFQLPIQIGAQVATDGKYVVGDFSDTETPPQLFVYQPGEEKARVFAKLNPQFDGLTLAHSEEVHWKTSTGFDASGLLLLPPGYVKGARYPLVIHTKPFANSFVCGFGNSPSFAPQPLANAGIMYLGTIPTKGSTQREVDFFPKGYPGSQEVGISEAAFAMDLWDSAVRALDEQGLIDGSKVGIIGFSRTGWYTEFILAHSKIHYRAATVADNVQYSLGEYWLPHDAGGIKMFDLMYGGPPYGTTLKNWLDYSVSFNLDRIHTPLLMEQMGYGMPYDNIKAPPLSLADSFEVFTGLNRLNKPVELYYYPNEDHTPEHPQARLATLQRNLDWYRFWLKDEEDRDPAKAEQYKRWRELRKLQLADSQKVDHSSN